MKDNVIGHYQSLKQIQRLPLDLQKDNVWYSLRRYYVDEFYFRHVPALPVQSSILDLGGMKLQKRGQFDIGRYDYRVIYANLLLDNRPDVQCDARVIPFKSGSFSTIICSEVLEYVSNPGEVLAEMSRVLDPEGVVLICIPFLYRIQGHPVDYGRYTHVWWGETLTALGFHDITIEWQGFFASVLFDMLRDTIAYKGGASSKRVRKLFKWCGNPLVRRLRRKMLQWDERMASRYDASAAWFCSYTTGFGIRAVKR